MKRIMLMLLVVAGVVVAGCSADKKTTPEAASETAQTTTVTDENYGLAETQVIIAGYVEKIAAATGTNGMGVWMNNKKGANPKDRDVMRKNYDTIYSWAVFDLTEPATIVLPENKGRYQTAWVMSEEHYNPFALVKPGEYTLTRENVGTPYAIVVVRTQANVEDPRDMAAANALQEKLAIRQEHKGSTYLASHQWNMDEILKMRTKYQDIAKNEKVSPDLYFGKKGERTLKQHNCGTAVGWGGFTPDQAAYVDYYPTSAQPQTLALTDVPADAFWSITVYDDGGFCQTDTYNINSQFAKKDANGTAVIHFGGDKNQDNYMEIFEGWTFILRLYLPQENYLDGSWKRPELQPV